MATESLLAEKETKTSNLRFHAGESKKGVQNNTPDRFRPLGYLYENDTKLDPAVIQAKLLYEGSEVTKKTLKRKLAELETQKNLGLVNPELRTAVIIGLKDCILDEKNTYNLDVPLIEQIKADALRKLEEKRAQRLSKKQSEAEVQALEQHRKSQAQELFEYLKGQAIQEISADQLKQIFIEHGFETKQDISEKSSVLGTIIVTAHAGGREYLYVEIHPKGGIHYSSYVLIGLYGEGKNVINRHKVVMSKSVRYLGMESEKSTTTFSFSKPDSGFSNMGSGAYSHRSRYFSARSQGEKSQNVVTDEGEDFLAQKSTELYAMRPIDMAKGKQMLALGFWDEMLYVSVQKMKAAKEWAMRLKQGRAEEDSEAIADLLSQIHTLDLGLYDLKMDNLENQYRLEKIKQELEKIKQELEKIEQELMMMERGGLPVVK